MKRRKRYCDAGHTSWRELGRTILWWLNRISFSVLQTTCMLFVHVAECDDMGSRRGMHMAVDTTNTNIVSTFKSPKHKLLAVFLRGRKLWKAKCAKLKKQLKFQENKTRATLKSRAVWRGRARQAKKEAATFKAEAAHWRAMMEEKKSPVSYQSPRSFSRIGMMIPSSDTTMASPSSTVL